MVFILSIFFVSTFCFTADQSLKQRGGDTSNLLMLTIDRGQNLSPWQRTLDMRFIDKNLFAIFDSVDLGVESMQLKLDYTDIMDYSSSEGLDCLLKALPYFSYRNSEVAGNPVFSDMSTFEKASAKLKQHCNQMSADQIQQALLWGDKLWLHPELVSKLKPLFVDMYVDALLRTDFIAIKPEKLKYYLPSTVEIDKYVAKHLVKRILQQHFSDQNRNYNLGWQRRFITSNKALIKRINNSEAVFFSRDEGGMLTIPRSGIDEYFVFDNTPISDLCWIPGIDRRWEITKLFNKYIIDSPNEVYDNKFIVTIGTDNFIQIYTAEYIYDARHFKTPTEEYKLKLKEFNKDVSDFGTLIVPESYNPLFKIDDAAIISDATGAVYLGFGNVLYRMHGDGSKVTIKNAVKISDTPAQISGLNILDDTLAVTYKQWDDVSMQPQWNLLLDQYACYKITNTGFSRYNGDPAGFDMLKISWDVPRANQQPITKSKMFLIPTNDNLITIHDIISARGLNHFSESYTATFDFERRKILALTKAPLANFGDMFYVREYEIVPPQLRNFIVSLNQKAKQERRSKQGDLILAESLTYDTLLYIKEQYPTMAPLLKISYGLKPVSQKISATLSSNPMSNLYHYLRNSYFALGGHKKRDLQGTGVLLFAGGVLLTLFALAIRKDIKEYRSTVPNFPNRTLPPLRMSDY